MSAVASKLCDEKAGRWVAVDARFLSRLSSALTNVSDAECDQIAASPTGLVDFLTRRGTEENSYGYAAFDCVSLLAALRDAQGDDAGYWNRKLVFPAHVNGNHWVTFCVDVRGSGILCLDPLGEQYSKVGKSKLCRALRLFLKCEAARGRGRADVDDVATDEIAITHNPDGQMAQQADGTSCGAFALAYAIFLVRQDRLPSNADFTGHNRLAVRLAILDFFVDK